MPPQGGRPDWRAFCIMSRRVTGTVARLSGRRRGAGAKASPNRATSRVPYDPKPSDLPLARVKPL